MYNLYINTYYIGYYCFKTNSFYGTGQVFSKALQDFPASKM